MPYSERAQSDKARTLPKDEKGYFELEWRPADDVLEDLKACGVDVSDFSERVEKCKANLVPEVFAGRMDANTLDEDAITLALLGYIVALPPGNGIEMKKKVYYGESVSISGLIEQ